MLSSLLTALLLPWYSFVGVLSLLQMCFKVSGEGGSLREGGIFFWVGRLSVIMVLVVLSLPLILGKSGFFRIYMVFTSGFLIPLRNDFLKEVVVSRRDVGIRKWTRWLREDLSSRPYSWLRPDFVPPSPFLVIKDPQTQSSRILIEPHLVDAEFRKDWLPISVGLVILSSLQSSSWILLDIFCQKSLTWIFLGFRGGTCRRWFVLRSLLLEGWMGGLGMRSRHSLFLGSLGWLFSWSW